MVKQFVVTFAAVLLAAVVAFFLLLPDDASDLVSAWTNRIAPTRGSQCPDAIRENFKDPASVELVNEEVLGYDAAEKKENIRITYRAQNSFGAYQSSAFDCNYPMHASNRPMEWSTARVLISGDF